MATTARINRNGPLAIRLRHIRHTCRLEQRQVCAIAGVSRSQLQALEGGSEANPTLNTLGGLAYAYGVSLSHLLEGI